MAGAAAAGSIVIAPISCSGLADEPIAGVGAIGAGSGGDVDVSVGAGVFVVIVVSSLSSSSCLKSNSSNPTGGRGVPAAALMAAGKVIHIDTMYFKAVGTTIVYLRHDVRSTVRRDVVLADPLFEGGMQRFGWVAGRQDGILGGQNLRNLDLGVHR